MKKGLFFLLVLCLGACAPTSQGYEYEFTDEGGHQQIVSVDVTLQDGVIEKITIDETFTTKDGESTTKKKLKNDYNMKGSSDIEKEWFEQIEFLEDILKGTDGQLALDENGKPTDTEVLTGCTIDLTHIMSAVQEAISEKQ